MRVLLAILTSLTVIAGSTKVGLAASEADALKQLAPLLNKDISDLSQAQQQKIADLVFAAEEEGLLKLIFPKTWQDNINNLVRNNPQGLSPIQLDRVRLLSGGMEPWEYLQSYTNYSENSVVRHIAEAIWSKWQTEYIPGAQCSNGSPYKVFIQKAKGLLSRLKGYDHQLLIYMEPGGACWDYASCSGQAGVRGAANPNGIPDNYMNVGDFIDPNVAGGSIMPLISPALTPNHPSGYRSSSSHWNKVFVPYCTGDVHLGNKTSYYQHPTDPTKDLTFRHLGAPNVEKAAAKLAREFTHQENLLVSGCSAGGTGSLGHYHTFRKAIAAQRGMMLNDSGPIFPAPSAQQGHQWPLQQKVKQAWNVDYILDKLATDLAIDPDKLKANFGTLPTVLAQHYNQDRLAVTLFKRDLNYSSYSYARFYGIDETTPAGKAQLIDLWNDDVATMIQQFDQEPNLFYFVPYERTYFESHCTMVVSYKNSTIEDDGIHVGEFSENLISGRNLASYQEAPNSWDRTIKDPTFELLLLLQEMAK